MIYCVIVMFSMSVIHQSLSGYVFSLSICMWFVLYYRFQYYIFGVIWVSGEYGKRLVAGIEVEIKVWSGPS